MSASSSSAARRRRDHSVLNAPPMQDTLTLVLRPEIRRVLQEEQARSQESEALIFSRALLLLRHLQQGRMMTVHLSPEVTRQVDARAQAADVSPGILLAGWIVERLALD